MNEQIRQLALQAGLIKILDEHAHEYGNGMFENTPYPELEKFAELIVRECAGVTLDYKNDDHYAGWVDHQAEILKHFGVQE